MKIYPRLSENVRGKFDKTTKAEITWEQLIIVCKIANGALKLIFFYSKLSIMLK